MGINFGHGNVLIHKKQDQRIPNKIQLCSITHFISTHWGQVTHIGVSELTVIGSDKGLSPSYGRHQAIIYTNAGILLIRILG